MTNIPGDIGEVFEELKSEITWLHGRWIIYRQLFGCSDTRVALLNECASAFFYVIQDVLLNEVMLALSKLTDSARSRSFANLSLEQLQERIEARGESRLAAEIRVILNDLHSKCGVFRTRRNKRLAHLDLTTAMQSASNPLPGISRQMVEEALQLVREYMNAIEAHYDQSETGYEHFIMSSDGDALVALLKYGLRYDELLRDGNIPMGDWNEGHWKDA